MTAWRNGRRVQTLDTDERGFHYGDGLFETMRVHAGAVPLWPLHRERLLRGAERLGLEAPAPAALERERDMVLRELPGREATLKLVLTRPAGPRGYAPPRGAATRWWFADAAPSTDAAPLAIVDCALRLGTRPALAGLKHLGRLEEVLARAEVDARGADEGLLYDVEGFLVGATAGNVFLVRDGRVQTPPLERVGVAGVARAALLEPLAVDVRSLRGEDVADAQEIFLTNALRGIRPVGRHGERRLRPGLACLAARAALAARGFPVAGD